ncbi:MAG: rhodanese-like domain-containing protein [Acidobacteriota bacterium]
MKHYFVQALVILVLGSIFGLVYNALSPSGIPLFAAQDTTVTGFKMMTTDEVMLYMKEKKISIIVVDARSPEEYGLGHIPGAINIPDTDVENYYKKYQDKLKKAELIIVYCSGGSCGSSEEVASQLIKKGIPASKVAVHQDGLPGWIKAKNPIEFGDGK